jgi:FKBP-type peptidyl-prolyl cis-trans isomerase FkpA
MQTKTMMIVVLAALTIVSCGTQYSKTKSGLVYKIIKGKGKDSVARTNDIVKFHYVRKINDSLIASSFGKMPYYQPLPDKNDPGISYSPIEILYLMREGDSAITIEIADTLIKKGYQQQIPYIKSGDRLKTYLKLVKIFKNDSLARADANMEYEKDRPRQEKEMKEEMAKQKTKEDNELQAYFTEKKIKPEKAPEGTYVLIKEKGNGEPAAVGKFVAVKYEGRLIKNNEQFDAGVYVFQLGLGNAIQGWHDGIPLFNKGGKGVLFVPARLAYGPDPRGPGGANSSLKFDVEILEVSDKQEKADAAKKIADSLGAKTNPK